MNIITIKSFVLAAVAAMVFGMIAEGGDEPWQPPKDALKVEVRITNDEEADAELPAVYHVGDTLTAEASITNVAERKVRIPEGTRKIRWRTHVTGIPSAQQGPTRIIGSSIEDYTPSHRWTTRGGVRIDFCEIQPGEGWKSTWDFTIFVPGELEIVAIANYPFRVDLSSFPGVWAGFSSGNAEPLVSEEMSPEMQQQFDEAGKIVDSADEPLDRKLTTLESIAREKHYFAARFVWDVWKTTPDDTIKAAALGHLCDLLEFGTAYEALHDVVRLLRDERLDAQAKGRILGALGSINWANWLRDDDDVRSGRPGLAIAEGQGYYLLPDAIVEDVRAALLDIRAGDNPELAAKARALLNGGEPKSETE